MAGTNLPVSAKMNQNLSARAPIRYSLAGTGFADPGFMTRSDSVNYFGRDILLIHDHFNARSFTAAFFRNAGYKVKEVFAGKFGIDTILGQSFNLIIADLRANENFIGIEVLAYYKKAWPHSARMLLAHRDCRDTALDLSRRVNAVYVEKPIMLNYLVLTAESLLNDVSAAKNR